MVVVHHPLIAWIDGRQQVELNDTGKGYVARIRTLGIDAVTELPLKVPTWLSDYPSVLFTFRQPNEGRIGGQVGVSTNHPRQRDEHYVTWLSRVIPGSDSWRVETREVVWKCSEHPGYFHRCVLSPDGKRLAWKNYFTETEANAILISDAEGKNARVVYEHLYPMRNYEKGRAESMSVYSLEWTPQGDALAFWRGGHGENGLCLLPLPTR